MAAGSSFLFSVISFLKFGNRPNSWSLGRLLQQQSFILLAENSRHSFNLLLLPRYSADIIGILAEGRLVDDRAKPPSQYIVQIFFSLLHLIFIIVQIRNHYRYLRQLQAVFLWVDFTHRTLQTINLTWSFRYLLLTTIACVFRGPPSFIRLFCCCLRSAESFARVTFASGVFAIQFWRFCVLAAFSLASKESLIRHYSWTLLSRQISILHSIWLTHLDYFLYFTI